MKKTIMFLIVIAFSVTLVMGAGSQEESVASDDVVLDFQVWITPVITLDDWEKDVALFEAENPGIKVNIIEPTAGDSDANNFLKTRLAAGNFPDVVTVITEEIFVEADALLELPIDEDVVNVRGLDTMLNNGKLYRYDAMIQPHSLIYYNKTKFKDAGITDVPTTWDEFETACAKLKKAGEIPVMMAGADWASSFVFSVFATTNTFYNNQRWYADRNVGDVSFLDDNWIETAERFKKFADESYIYPGALGTDYATAEQLFISGQGAMYPMGSWFTGTEANAELDFEVGVFASPTKDGGKYLAAPTNRAGYAVSKETEHPEEAIKLAKFFIFKPEVFRPRLKLDGGIPAFVDPTDFLYEMTELQKEILKITQEAEVITNHLNHPVGGPGVPGIEGIMVKAAQSLLSGGDVETSLQWIEDYWEENKME